MIDRRPTNVILADPATPRWIKAMMSDPHPFRERVAEMRQEYRRECRRQQRRVALSLGLILLVSVGLWLVIIAAINAWVAPFLWATPV